MDRLRQGAGTPPPAGLRPGSPEPDSPVFVDASGRRRRVWRRAGIAVGAALLAGLGLLATGLFGNTPLGTPSWPSGQMRNVTTPSARPAAPPAPRPSSVAPVAGRASGTGTAATSAPPVSQRPSTTHPGNGRKPSHTPGKGRPSRTR